MCIIGVNFYPTNIIRTSHLTTTEDGVIISYNIYRPVILSASTPVVVMGHGIIVNKEMMSNFAVELAHEGLIVASIDWRGHGQSTGDLIIRDYSNRKDCPDCPPCPCEEEETLLAPVAPLAQFEIPRVEGCPVLTQAAAMELGITGKLFRLA